jgi:hypothetical protein
VPIAAITDFLPQLSRGAPPRSQRRLFSSLSLVDTEGAVMEPAWNLAIPAAGQICSHSKKINASLANYDTPGFKLGQWLETGTAERGLLGVHSRCGLHTRTVTKSRPLSRGFRHFVTSMPAPVASGWSGCRVGLAPTGKRRLARRTGHATISNCSFNRWRRTPVSGIRRHGYCSC